LWMEMHKSRPAVTLLIITASESNLGVLQVKFPESLLLF
jgi:hypothetical protein